MKRIILFYLLFFLSIFEINAQVRNYTFSNRSGAFEENSANATPISILSDDVLSNVISFPNDFEFWYDGATYTSMKVSSNGFITFNTSSTSALSSNDINAANTTSRPIIAPLWDDLAGEAPNNASFASYEVTGSAPNRVITVEWKNWEWIYNSNMPVVSFQVKLYETSNIIEFHYRDEENQPTTPTASIGINSRTQEGGYLNVLNVVQHNVSSSVVQNNINIKPTTGTIYRFSPPTCLSVSNLSYNRNALSAINFEWDVNGQSSSLVYQLSTSSVIDQGVISEGVLAAYEDNVTILHDYTQDGIYYFHIKNLCSVDDETSWTTIKIEGGLVGVESSTKSSILPISPNYGYNFSQQIYYADEIAAALVNENHHYITKVKFHFDKKTSANPLTYGNWKVFLAHTDKIEFTGTANTNWVPIADLNEVFSGDVNFPDPTNDWFEIDLDTPFAWDGTSNIVLAVLETVPSYSSGAEFKKYDTGSVYRGAIYRDDYTLPNMNNIQVIKSRNTHVPLIKLVGEAIPPCLPVTRLGVSNVTKNTVNISWNASLSEVASYTYEIRTSGLPGTAGAVITGNVDNDLSSVIVTNLTPGTTYYVYIKSNCGDGAINWTDNVVEFTTLCNYPDLSNLVTDAICGIGSANLSVNVSNNGIVEWFETATSLNNIFEGANFETPDLNVTRTYYVGSATVANNQNVQIGNAVATSDTYSNPFYSLYSNNRTQHLITAEELNSYGLRQGNITSLGLDVTSAGTLPMLNFTLKIGAVSDVEELENFVANDNFTTVNTNASFMPVLGVNTILFDQPYNWDGVSDLVLEFCHYNPASTATMSRAVKADNTAYKSTIKTHITVQTDTATICNNTTTNKLSYTLRPVFIFNGTGLCRSPKEEIEIVVSPAPVITLSKTTINDVCQGVNSEVITITDGAEDFDTFIWEPSEGVFGDGANGFYFNVHQNTQFKLKAINSDTGCRNDVIVNVNIISAGYSPLEEEAKICLGETIELNITPDQNLSIVRSTDDFVSYSFDDVENLGWSLNRTTGNVATIQNSNIIASEGAGFIRLSHGTSETGTIAMDNSIDLSNADGVMIEFNHMAILEGSSFDYGFVEYSLNGGETWFSFSVDKYIGSAAGLVQNNVKRFGRQSYTDWTGRFTGESVVPNEPMWKTEKFVLMNDGSIDLSNVKFRFSYRSDISNNYYGWLIDDVKIKSVNGPTYVWDSETEMYSDAEASIRYNGESTKKIYVKPSIAGSHNVSVTVTTDVCVSTDVIKVYVPNVVVPDFSNEVYCEAVSVNDMTFQKTEGHTYTWYSSLTSTTPIDQITTTGIYFVDVQFDGCSVPRMSVLVRVIGNVSVTVNAVQKFCDAATVADLVAIGTANDAVINWYSSLDSTTPLSLTTPLVNNAKYYVSQDIHGCITNRKEVTVKIFDTPSAIVTNQLNVCSNTLVRSLTIDGTNQLNWYRSINDTNPIASTLILESGVYYVAAKNDICESDRIRVTVNVVENLPVPQISLLDFCGNGTVAELDNFLPALENGSTYKWYRTVSSNEAINPATALTTGTYYLEVNLAGCSSTRKPVAVRVNSKIAPVINSQVVCENTMINDLVFTLPSGVEYQWFETPSSNVALAGTTILQSKYYYVKRVQFGCVSESARVLVTVQSAPSSPTGEALQEFVQGSTIDNIVMNQPNVVWYINEDDALTGNNPILNTSPLVDGHTYYGVLTSVTNCRSLPTPVEVKLFLSTIKLDIEHLKVYPNPTEGEINVTYLENIDEVEIYSLSGQLIFSANVNSNSASFNLSHLSSATYLMKIIVGDTSHIVKFIKK